jgi:hypothetical protein
MSVSDEDTVEFDSWELPDEMAECIWEAFTVGRRMRQSLDNYSVNHNPFQPGTELAFAWRKGFLQQSLPVQTRCRCPEKVDWRHEGF